MAKRNKKQKNNNLQNIAHKTKDRATRIQLLPVEFRWFKRVSSSCSMCGSHRPLFIIHFVSS